MPQVGQKHFPYTEAGEKAARKARKRFNTATMAFDDAPRIRSGQGSAKQGGMNKKAPPAVRKG